MREFLAIHGWSITTDEPVKTVISVLERVERERDEAREQLAAEQKHRNVLQGWKDEMMSVESQWNPQVIGKLLGMTLGSNIRLELESHIRELLGELVAERAMADRLAEYLVRLRDCDWTITLPDRMDAVRSIAREALSAHRERRGKEAQQ